MNYAQGQRLWLDFCVEQHIDPSIFNERRAQDFVCFMYQSGTMSGDAADKYLTAVTALHFECTGRRLIRSDFVSALLKGFKRKRVKVWRSKLPWSFHHNRWLVKVTDLKIYDELVLCASVLLGYGGMLRPGEFAKTQWSPLLTYGQLQFHPNKSAATDLVITLHCSKTNKIGKPERIIVSCYCKTKVCNVWTPCPVHFMLKYLSERDKVFPTTSASPLLIKRNGYVVSYQNVRRFLRSKIKCIADASGKELNVQGYPPHCLRVGATTDRARAGDPAYLIEQKGRWNSKCWKSIYINLDWRDISLLTSQGIADLQRQAKTPFMDGA